jgi:hypothetical protein
MSFGNLPTYTEEQLEREATRFLTEHFGPDVPLPVDIEWLTETLEGVDFDCYPALRANYGVEGGTWRDPATGKLLVCIDEDVMDDDSQKGAARYRMAVAEQLGHLLIHREALASLNGPDQFREFHNQILGTKVERDTRRLAAALLMPAGPLAEEAKKTYRQLVQLVGTDNVPAVQKYLCSRLAKQFNVSEATMHHRLNDEPLRLYHHVEQAMRRGLSSLP